jgi:predicted nucleotidyltransferase
MTVDEIVRHRLGVDPERIAAFCQKWQIKELALFGSALTDDFRADSDVDLLVVFEDPHRSFGPWGGELQDMRNELEAMFGRKVDLVEKRLVKNPFRRHRILTTRQVIYAA